MSRQKETLQERLQARIDKHRDPRGNICLGTYNHWDSALDLEAIGSLDAAQAEIARLKDQVELAWHEHSVAVARISLPVAEDVVECDESNSFVKPKSSKRYKLVPVDQPGAAPEGLIRNAALQEAAAHLRDMGYWTQASAVLSLCTNASAPTPASAVASEAFNRELTEQERQQIIGSGRDAGLEEAAEYHSSEARRLRADAKRYAESDYKPNHELVVPVTRQAENHEYFARNIRSLKSASTPREEARALADAGYMPVSEYVRLFGEK